MPARHVPVGHITHALPPLPHAPAAVPARHCPAEQHPVHDVESHTHAPLTQCSPAAQLPTAHTPPQPSFAPHGAPAQLGVHTQTPLAPPPPQVSGKVQVFPAQHGWPLPPHVPQPPVPHVVPLGHVAHTPPPLPHAAFVSPGSHVLALQHPLQDVGSHAHAPSTQCWPLPQLPDVHTPPQPSLAPHALPAQLGAHPQMPLAPPPPQVSGGAHVFPAQQTCPLPPHVPHSPVPQVVPPAQIAHATPPWPHAVFVLPTSHVLPLQQPLHEVPSHTHAPLTQCWPVAQVPAAHTPPQPSLAPHALPAQLGVQGPVPQTLVAPLPPHVSPAGHPPQSTRFPQWSRS
jgi:hypothetical protein